MPKFNRRSEKKNQKAIPSKNLIFDLEQMVLSFLHTFLSFATASTVSAALGIVSILGSPPLIIE